MRRAFRRVPLRLRLLATVALVSGFLVLTLYETGALNGLERQTVDARFDLRGSKSPGNGIVRSLWH